jgi:hypothetical protein
VVVNTLKVTNTLKSATPLERVTAINLNFGGSFAMKPGQRYILFLSEYTATGAQMVEERAGAPRFRAGAALCVEDTDRVYSSTRGSIGVGNRVMLSPLLGPLDGLTLDKALVEIRSALGTAPAK